MIHDVLKKTSKVLVDNSPAILTGIAVVGAVGSAILATQATVTATRIIDDYETNEGRTADFVGRAKEVVPLVWTLYVPAASTLAVTISCIIASNRVGTRRAALLASAYSLSEKAFSEYKDKVIEVMGEGKEQKVRDEVAKKRVNENPPVSREILITGNGEVLCYETMTGRYFQSTVETLRQAQNDLNARILKDMYASLNDFYRLINLPETGLGEELGWTVDKLLDLQFSSILTEDKKPCLAVGYSSIPIREYYKFG